LDYYKESKIQVSDDASKEIGHEILQLFWFQKKTA
jgi:hypothetical protein